MAGFSRRLRPPYCDTGRPHLRVATPKRPVLHLPALLRHGLPEHNVDEAEHLAALARKPLHRRIAGYFRMTGPGYMQSALTLGGGSVAACVWFGSLVGYELLWVQPVSMVLGYFVMAAIAKQVCHTGERPYRVFWERLSPVIAVAWGVGALAATVIWHFPQYSLTANGVISLAGGVGLDLDNAFGRVVIGAVLVAASCLVISMYNRGARGVKHFERATKIMVWTIVFAFAAVALITGIQWKRLLLGLTGVSFVRDWMDGGIDPILVKPIVAGMAAVTGINMFFLYSYALLNRGWGKAHKELAYFDLISGMVVPFIFATGFMVLAVANTIGPAEGEMGQAVGDIRAIVPVLGPTFGQWLGSETAGNGAALLLIGLGMIAIGFTTIVTHMLSCGFIGCEMFGYRHEGRARFWFSLLPVFMVVGVGAKFPWQAAITASSINAIFMPMAVLCFIILLHMKSFMGDATPRGRMKAVWLVSLVTCLVVMTIAGYFGLEKNWATLREHLWTKDAPSAALDTGRAGAAGEAEAAPGLSEVVTHEAMGTVFECTLYARPGDASTSEILRIADEAFAVVDDLEDRISRWRRDSQTAYINRHAAQEPVRVSPDILDLLLYATRAHEETDGAFDVTVGPLIALWGFYKGQGVLPSDDALSEAVARVGMDEVVIDRSARTVAYTRDGVLLDFGGIAKGWALDLAAEVLRSHGVTSAVLHGGTSTVVAIGAPPDRAAWTVRIRDPYNKDKYVDEVALHNESLSTSAGYEKFIEVGGKAYCHIFDPRTGRPVEGMLSATAIAPSGRESDALSTAFFVMGVEKTSEYCQTHPDVRAVLIPCPEGDALRLVRIGKPKEEGQTGTK